MASAQLAVIAQIRDDNQRRRAEAGELQRRLEHEGSANSLRYDSVGYAKARKAIDDLLAAGDDSDPVRSDFLLRTARNALDEHLARLRDVSAKQRRDSEEARGELDSARALIEGLAADPMVMRWAMHSVDELRQALAEAEQAVAQGDYSSASGLSERVRSEEAALVKKANAAQIKADQRDYIANSIRQVLDNMGFFVGALREEHSGHPATALLLEARNAGGNGINVSIPYDGEVWYDIEGYPKHTVSKVGGGTAAVCDEAEQVIEEMHDILEDEFQVEMGELMWEGKDPDRILRSADELPKSGESEEREERR
jgi:hypothetical protein